MLITLLKLTTLKLLDPWNGIWFANLCPSVRAQKNMHLKTLNIVCSALKYFLSKKCLTFVLILHYSMFDQTEKATRHNPIHACIRFTSQKQKSHIHGFKYFLQCLALDDKILQIRVTDRKHFLDRTASLTMLAGPITAKVLKIWSTNSQTDL